MQALSLMMNCRFLTVITLALLCFVSCVSTKQLTYLQEDNLTPDEVVEIRRLQEPYRLQVNDLLSIQIKTLDQNLANLFNPQANDQGSAATQQGEAGLYNTGFSVDVRGNIRVPTLGEVYVLGLTQEEVRKKIEALLLDRYFKEESQLYVKVNLAGIRYTTVGEIGTGSQVIYKNQVTIMEAIANAGDITVTGDRTNVKIVRTYPDGVRVHHIDLTTLDAVNSPYYFIQPNDLIVVDPLPQKALGTGTTGLQSFTTIVSVLTLLTSTILLFIRL